MDFSFPLQVRVVVPCSLVKSLFQLGRGLPKARSFLIPELEPLTPEVVSGGMRGAGA